jgi:hypothetical protein
VSANVDYNGADRQINLTSATSIIDLLDVRLRYLATDYPVIRKVRLQRDLPTSDFASGFALVFDESVMAGTLRVRYKAPFTRVSTISDSLQSVANLPVTMEDILEMGVMSRMLSTREVKRNFIESQGDTRRSDEVPPGAMRDSFSNSLLNLVSRLLTRRVCGVGRSRLGIMVQGKLIRILLTLRHIVFVLTRV